MPNNKKSKFWNLKKINDNVAELTFFGEIADSKFFGDETTPTEIKSELDKLEDVKTLNIYINSPGGSVFAGQAIYNMLKRYPAEKVVYVDGLAASIASVIAMAGDKIVMPRNSMMMIHKASSIAVGTSDDFLKMAETLDRIEKSIVEVYKNRTNLDENTIQKMMNAETWMSAEEAVSLNFADELEENKLIAANANGLDLTINGLDVKSSDFKNFPVFTNKKNFEIIATDVEKLDTDIEKVDNKENLVTTANKKIADDINKFLKIMEEK